MSELATIEPASAPVVLKPRRERRISKRLEQAIELLESGECATQKAAAIRVGMSDTYLCRALKDDRTRVFIARKRAENIALGSLKASRRIVQLVDAESEHVAAKVSERLLEQSGDLKTQSGGININVSNNVSAGYVVDLTPWKPLDQAPVIQPRSDISD